MKNLEKFLTLCSITLASLPVFSQGTTPNEKPQPQSEIKSADKYALLSDYKDGDSLAFKYLISADSHKKGKMRYVEKKLLSILREKEVSDAAFAIICDILKPVATEESAEVLKKFLLSDTRSAHACDVLISMEYGDADDVLRDALKKSESARCSMPIISTLAARGTGNIEAIAEAADNPDGEIALFAVCALGRFADSDVLEALDEISEKNDFRKSAALDAILSIADSAAISGNKSLAWDALELIPADEPRAVFARAAIAKDSERGKYLDSLIIAGGKCSESAARTIGDSRIFEDSAEIIRTFPSLTTKSKIAVIATFMQNPDTRYWDVVSPEISSADADLRAQAVYAARFLCRKESDLNKIFKILKDPCDPCNNLAQCVFLENPFPESEKILRENAFKGDLGSLKILVKRGDTDAEKKLWEMYLSEKGMQDPNISAAFRDCLTYGSLPKLAEYFASAKKIEGKSIDANGKEIRTVFDQKKELAKLIIKKLALSRDKEFIRIALPKILDGKLEASDPLRKFIEDKLENIPSK